MALGPMRWRGTLLYVVSAPGFCLRGERSCLLWPCVQGGTKLKVVQGPAVCLFRSVGSEGVNCNRKVLGDGSDHNGVLVVVPL